MLPHIVQYSSLQPYKKSGRFLSSGVTDHPLRPAKDHRLGGPLPPNAFTLKNVVKNFSLRFNQLPNPL